MILSDKMKWKEEIPNIKEDLEELELLVKARTGKPTLEAMGQLPVKLSISFLYYSTILALGIYLY